MRRPVWIVLLALCVALAAAGCVPTYYHSEIEHGFRRSEFGLLGSGEPGGIPAGLIPLYRGNVELERAEEAE